MWQGLRSRLDLEVVSVALDADVEAARAYVELAQVDFPVLSDRSHLLGELFGITNVPSSVWIDEQGMIVRPVETSTVKRRGQKTGIKDPRSFDPAMFEVAAAFTREPEAYIAALTDWAVKGAASRWALSSSEVVARSAPRSADTALAAAHFELGEHFHRCGETAAAQGHWREAHRLAPENWTYKRQAWELVDPGAQGPTEVYEGSWIEDVRKAGPENYYGRIE